MKKTIKNTIIDGIIKTGNLATNNPANMAERENITLLIINM